MRKVKEEVIYSRERKLATNDGLVLIKSGIAALNKTPSKHVFVSESCNLYRERFNLFYVVMVKLYNIVDSIIRFLNNSMKVIRTL